MKNFDEKGYNFLAFKSKIPFPTALRYLYLGSFAKFCSTGILLIDCGVFKMVSRIFCLALVLTTSFDTAMIKPSNLPLSPQ